MANPFVKAWKYLMAKLDLTVEENADPKVQIEQAIAEAKRQHQELSQQAAAVVGNQRQLEMKMNRQLADVEKIKNNVRQALLMAEDARKKGDKDKAGEYENAANAFSAQLVTAETAVTDLKSLYAQSSGASDAARAAVERNARVLQQQLAERTKLLNQLDQAKIDSEENQRLRNLLNLRQQRRDFTFESAVIVDRSTSNWSRVMTLNKGTSSGIAVGNCVVDDQGNLVGVIREAGLNWSTITTILDTDSSLGARVFRTGEVTVAMGDLALMETGRLKLSYLEGESSLINGDLIVTSGLGGYYPSQLVIGSVEEIRTDDNGLTRYAVLAPKTDLDSLSEVFVITSFDTVD